jgi:hypothetical protein
MAIGKQAGVHLQKLTELANLGVLHLRRAGSGQGTEGRGEDAAGCPENAGGILMRWPWRQRAKPIEPRRAAVSLLTGLAP